MKALLHKIFWTCFRILHDLQVNKIPASMWAYNLIILKGMRMLILISLNKLNLWLLDFCNWLADGSTTG